MNSENPYKVPTKYFDELKGKILQQTVQNPEAKTQNTIEPEFFELRSSRTRVRWRSMVGFAAGFAIFVMLGVGGVALLEKFSGQKIDSSLVAGNSPREYTQESLFAEMVLEYVEDYGIDEEAIYEVVE